MCKYFQCVMMSRTAGQHSDCIPFPVQLVLHITHSTNIHITNTHDLIASLFLNILHSDPTSFYTERFIIFFPFPFLFLLKCNIHPYLCQDTFRSRPVSVSITHTRPAPSILSPTPQWRYADNSIAHLTDRLVSLFDFLLEPQFQKLVPEYFLFFCNLVNGLHIVIWRTVPVRRRLTSNCSFSDCIRESNQLL